MQSFSLESVVKNARRLVNVFTLAGTVCGRNDRRPWWQNHKAQQEEITTMADQRRLN